MQGPQSENEVVQSSLLGSCSHVLTDILKKFLHQVPVTARLVFIAMDKKARTVLNCLFDIVAGGQSTSNKRP